LAEKDVRRFGVVTWHQVAVGVILIVQALASAAFADITEPEHFREFLESVGLGCQLAGVLTELIIVHFSPFGCHVIVPGSA